MKQCLAYKKYSKFLVHDGRRKEEGEGGKEEKRKERERKRMVGGGEERKEGIRKEGRKHSFIMIHALLYID